MTAIGKDKFIEYVTELERVISDAAKLRGAATNVSTVSRAGWTTG